LEGGDTLLQKSSNNINAKNKTLYFHSVMLSPEVIIVYSLAYSQFANEVDQGAEKSALYQRREE